MVAVEVMIAKLVHAEVAGLVGLLLAMPCWRVFCSPADPGPVE
jgi:hypothetical protein